MTAFYFGLTDHCNFRCTYCYQKGDRSAELRSLDFETIRRALDFFFPAFEPDAYVGIYGGEPLLEWQLVKDTVDYALALSKKADKPVRFTMTTNGMLLDEKKIEFLKTHRFYLALSFDGTAQESQRCPGTLEPLNRLIERLIRIPEIDFSVNSVFTAEHIDKFAESIEMVHRMGVRDVTHAFSTIEPWDDKALAQLRKEHQKLAAFYREFYPAPEKKKGKKEPEQKKLFACFAGRDRFFLAQDRSLWGCYLFGDHFKERKNDEYYRQFCFGDLDEFIANHETIYPKIAKNYEGLRQDYFYTEKGFCFDCPHLYSCSVCPVTSLLAGSPLAEKVPLWVCKMKQMGQPPKKPRRKKT